VPRKQAAPVSALKADKCSVQHLFDQVCCTKTQDQTMLDRLIAIQAIAADALNREEMWHRILEQERVADMAEVGVWRGQFAAHLLGQCSSIRTYTMIDPWRALPDWHKPANTDDAAFANIHAEAMARTDFAADKRRVLRCTTREAAPKIAPESLDMAYIDGDHTLRGITLDLMLMYEKLRPGGLLAGDDFVKSIWQHGPDYDPTFVCPYAIYFAEAVDVPIIALPFSQFLMIKDSSLGFELIHFTGGYRNLRLNQMVRMPARFREHPDD
jgi:hypothetical protein